MGQPGRREATARPGVAGAKPGGPRAVRTVAIALGGVSAALCVLAALTFSRTGNLKRELAEARKDVARLSERAESLATGLAGAEGELHKLRLASADAAALRRRPDRPEPRRSTPPNEGRTLAPVDAAPGKRADLETLTRGIRAAAEGFRAGPVGAAAGQEAKRERLPPGTEKFIAGSLEGMAEGVELWRRYRQGKMTDKEFERRRRELRDAARRDIGFFFAVLWRERMKGAPKEGGAKEKGGGDIF